MADALSGEGGAYVPCDELAAALPALPDGAIRGQMAGFVAKDELAASDPAIPAGAIRGATVGFVPKPCCPDWVDTSGGSNVSYMRTDDHFEFSLGETDDTGSFTSSLKDCDFSWTPTTRYELQFQLDNLGDPAIDFAEKIEIRFLTASIPFPATPRVVIFPSSASLWIQEVGATPAASAQTQITWVGDVISGTLIPFSFFANPATTFTFSVYHDGVNLIAEVTNGVTSYTTALGFTPTHSASRRYLAVHANVNPYVSTVPWTGSVDATGLPA